MDKEITILCIDDDAQICYTFEELFKFQGWNGISARNVEEGLEKLSRYQPDLVLIDYHMPRINGVEGVRRLRSLSGTMPIIVFTIDESQEVADAFLAAGATDFALKPIKAPDIISRIKLHLKFLEQGGPQPFAMTKGYSQNTMEIIGDFLKKKTDYLTANEIADSTGLAYQTVYRYLQYLTQKKLVKMLNLYGKVGRPKQVYRWDHKG